MGALFYEDIDIDEAVDAVGSYTWTAGYPATVVDMSAATGQVSFRKDYDSDVSVALVTGGGGLTLDASGNMAWALSAAQSRILVQDFCEGRGVYDLVITFPSAPAQYPNQRVLKYIAGAVRVVRSATR